MAAYAQREADRASGRATEASSGLAVHQDLNARSAVTQAKATAARLNARTAPVQRKPSRSDGLPDPLRASMEAMSGIALDDVRVHRNSDKPAQMQAHAYAQGTDIHLGPGQEKHLPHEAWHVVQQKQGRVPVTRNGPRGVAINDSPSLEREADGAGSAAQRLTSQRKPADPVAFLPSPGRIVQRVVTYAGDFHPNAAAPEIADEDDYEGYLAAMAVEDAQAAIDLYRQGDAEVSTHDESLAPALDIFGDEPDVELIVTTGPIASLGLTAVSVQDSHGLYRNFSPELPNPATTAEWPAWMTHQNPVRVTITIQEGLSKVKMVHTLNHEVSVHAVNQLTMVRRVRAMAHAQMARNFVEATAVENGVFSDTREHALLGADKNPRLKATHAAMKAASGDDNFNDRLDQDYASDVADHAHHVPDPYVPPHRRPAQAGGGGNAPVQLSRGGSSAQEEMKRAMDDYNEAQDWDDDEDYEAEDQADLNPLFGQLTSMSCGIAAVQMVLASKGKFMDASYIERLSADYKGAYDPEVGTAMTNMAKVLGNYVPCSTPKTLSLQAMLDKLNKGPVIARVVGASGHFVVIDSVTGNPPQYDGARGVRTAGSRVLHIRDPWPPGQGSHLDVTEEEFQSGSGELKTTALYIYME